MTAGGQPDLTPSGAERGLYPRLLGPGWKALDPAVRRAHADGDVLVGIGTFAISNGIGRLARLLTRCRAVPPAADACPIRVTIRRRRAEEHWLRRLGDARLVTVQRGLAGSLLAERLGVLEFLFRLAAADGALDYRQVGLVLCLGRFRARLPDWLAPCVAAHERPDADGISTDVAVEVTTPSGGLLFSYRGRVRWAVADAATTPR